MVARQHDDVMLNSKVILACWKVIVGHMQRRVGGDIKHGAARQVEKRKSSEKIHGCVDGGHAECWCARDSVRWKQVIHCGDPLREQLKREVAVRHNDDVIMSAIDKNRQRQTMHLCAQFGSSAPDGVGRVCGQTSRDILNRGKSCLKHIITTNG